MKQLQRGFTLIEIVMVIAILGILAAVAIPKYVDLKDEANTSAVQGVAGALAAASAINYASAKANKSGSVIDTTCSSAEASLTGGALPTGYATGGTFPAACTVGNGSKTATWKATDAN